MAATRLAISRADTGDSPHEGFWAPGTPQRAPRSAKSPLVASR